MRKNLLLKSSLALLVACGDNEPPLCTEVCPPGQHFTLAEVVCDVNGCTCNIANEDPIECRLGGQ